jgi:hypothetical protein
LWALLGVCGAPKQNTYDQNKKYPHAAPVCVAPWHTTRHQAA